MLVDSYSSHCKLCASPDIVSPSFAKKKKLCLMSILWEKKGYGVTILWNANFFFFYQEFMLSTDPLMVAKVKGLSVRHINSTAIPTSPWKELEPPAA